MSEGIHTKDTGPGRITLLPGGGHVATTRLSPSGSLRHMQTDLERMYSGCWLFGFLL